MDVTADAPVLNIWPVVAELAISVEPVGSTSVPGVAAKPIVDMTVVPSAGDDMGLEGPILYPLEYERALGTSPNANTSVDRRTTCAGPPSM